MAAVAPGMRIAAQATFFVEEMDFSNTVVIPDVVPQTTLRDWLAVASIAAAAFAIITAEFLPIGMLDAIAKSLGISIGRAGLIVTVPGLVATLSAPTLIVLASSIDRRRILQALTIALIFSGVVSAFAQQFYVLLAGRMLLGFAIGGFWTFALSAVRRLVREPDGGKALAMLSAAISFGTVMGVPAGAIGSRLFGWHAVFLGPTLLALLAFAGQVKFLHELPVGHSIDVNDLIRVLKNPAMQIVIAASCLVFGGHFIAYTFLEPYLQTVPSMSTAIVTSALLAYGLVGAFGNFAAERTARKTLRGTLISMVVVAPVVGISPIGALICVALWGAGFGAFPVTQQIWMYKTALGDFESSSALIVTTAQLSVASGSFIGGNIVDYAGLPVVFFAAGAFTTLALILVLVSLKRQASRELGVA